MAWSKKTWVDDDGSLTVGTPFSAAAMNNIETGIQEAQQPVLYLARAATTKALAGKEAGEGEYEATANGALAAQDGVAMAVGDRLLRRNDGALNGVYEITALGGASSKWKMRRISSMSQVSQFQAGMIVSILQGTLFAASLWEFTTTEKITLGLTSLSFTRPQAREIVGTVNSSGGILVGSGFFTVSHSATGVYSIAFTRPFLTQPVPGGIPNNSEPAASIQGAADTEHAVFQVLNAGGTALVNAGFSFSVREGGI